MEAGQMSSLEAVCWGLNGLTQALIRFWHLIWIWSQFLAGKISLVLVPAFTVGLEMKMSDIKGLHQEHEKPELFR